MDCFEQPILFASSESSFTFNDLMAKSTISLLVSVFLLKIVNAALTECIVNATLTTLTSQI